jgi:Protein of unknown function (DUF2793)
MSETSGRLALPMLAVAQAQKEMTHNEALAKLDAAVQPVVVAVAPATVPATPANGQCWIVGTAPTAAWAGQAGALAAWTTGGWRFIAPFDGMSAWSIADQGLARREGGVWRIAGRQAAIATPTGGTAIDSESRAAIAAILAVLRSSGMIAP